MLNLYELDKGPQILAATALETKKDYRDDRPFRRPSYRNDLFRKYASRIEATNLKLAPSVLTAGILRGDFADRRIGAVLKSRRSLGESDYLYLQFAHSLVHHLMGSVQILNSVNGVAATSTGDILERTFRPFDDEIDGFRQVIDPVAVTLENGVQDEALVDLVTASELAQREGLVFFDPLVQPISEITLDLYQSIYPHSANFLQNR